MSYLLPQHNALAWSQFRLRGGWRNTLVIIGAYTAIIGGLIFVSVRVDPFNAKNILYGWTLGLMGLQIGALLLVACSSLRTGLRRDIESRMIESHRLMPVSDVSAMIGYLFGCTAQAVVGAAANLLIGTITAAGGGIRVADWFAANAILAYFAVTCWIGIALASVLSRSAFGLIIAFVVIIAASQGIINSVLPGLMLLAAPAIKNTIFGILERGMVWGWEYYLSFCMQFMMAGLFFIAAARRFRRDDVPAFGTLLGLGLVLAWIILSVAGIEAWPKIRSMPFGLAVSMQGAQVICSTAAAILIALVPISNAAWDEVNWRRRRQLSDPALGPRPIPPGTVYVATTGMVLLLIIWIIVTWMGPMVLDAVRYQAAWFHGIKAPTFTGISAFGPLGALIALCGDTHVYLPPGVAFQCLVAVGIGLIYHRLQRNMISRPVTD
jgi:hypothetical protein